MYIIKSLTAGQSNIRLMNFACSKWREQLLYCNKLNKWLLRVRNINYSPPFYSQALFVFLSQLSRRVQFCIQCFWHITIRRSLMASNQGIVLAIQFILATYPSIWKYSVEILPDIDLVIGWCSILLKPYYIRWSDISFSKLAWHYFGVVLNNYRHSNFHQWKRDLWYDLQQFLSKH